MSRRLAPGITLATAVGVMIGAGLILAAPAMADTCSIRDPDCVQVVVTDPPTPGDPGTTSPGKPGPQSSEPPDPCAGYTGYIYQLCLTLGPGNSVPQFSCQMTYEDNYNVLPIDQLDAMLTELGCPTVPETVPPSPGTLAQQAAAGFKLPKPDVGRFPGGAGWVLQDGTPYTLVRIPTWFWTDGTTWVAQSATASAGGNWATVTAKPTTLSFGPGDGGSAVSCTGPGTPFDPKQDTVDGSWVPKPQPNGCDYRYPQTSATLAGGVVTATETITWSLTWTGSGNTSGVLTQRTTTSTATFAVAEAQSVVVR
jgi:hypothetical protein